MKRHAWRRVATAMAALTVVLFFGAVVALTGQITVGELILAFLGFAFAYIVVRLTNTMVAAEPPAQRRAARWLMIASVAPALLLTPTVLERAPANAHTHVIVVSLIWAALAMANTTFITRRARQRTMRRGRWVGAAALATSPSQGARRDLSSESANDELMWGRGGGQLHCLEDPSQHGAAHRPSDSDAEHQRAVGISDL